MHIDIEWDREKSASNRVKHGIGFDEAATALLDPMALVVENVDSRQERRWLLVGMSERSRLLAVVYTLRSDERIRLISARKATRREAEHYA